MQIAFYKGKKRFFNRFVSWYLRGPYSHAELVLGYTEEGEAICASSSLQDGGVRVKRIAFKPEHWDLLEIPDYHSAWEWLVHNQDKGYDILGLLGFVWRRQRGDKKRYFCTEAIAEMLDFPEPHRFDPMNLYAAIKGTEKWR